MSFSLYHIEGEYVVFPFLPIYPKVRKFRGKKIEGMLHTIGYVVSHTKAQLEYLRLLYFYSTLSENFLPFFCLINQCSWKSIFLFGQVDI